MTKTSENQKEKENLAYCYLGHGYVKIPRSILKMGFDKDNFTSKMGRVYLFLFYRCAFQEGVVTISKNAHACKSGEFLASYTMIADWTGYSRSTIHRILKHLEYRQLIRIETIASATRIYLYGYSKFTAGQALKFTGQEEREMGLAELEENLEKGIVYGR